MSGRIDDVVLGGRAGGPRDVTSDVVPREDIWLGSGRVLGDVPIDQIAMVGA